MISWQVIFWLTFTLLSLATLVYSVRQLIRLRRERKEYRRKLEEKWAMEAKYDLGEIETWKQYQERKLREQREYGKVCGCVSDDEQNCPPDSVRR